MRQFITLFLFFSVTLTCLGQTSFLDNFKTAKWKSADKFNDSTLLHLDKLTLTKWDYTVDSLKYYPTIWIFDGELKMKYYSNVQTSHDNTKSEEKASLNFMDCKYSFDEPNSLLTINLDDKGKTTLVYKVQMLSDNQTLLTRQK